MFDAKSAFDENGQPKPAVTKVIDSVLKIQRPMVVGMVKKLHEKHPNETPAQIAERLEKSYLRDITVGGGAVGASAFVPGIGTVTSVGFSVVAVAGYLERTAIYIQAMAELHGVQVNDPEEGRMMVMALMLGEDGSNLMSSILAQSTKAGGVSSKWGMMMGKSNNSGKLFSVEKTIRNMFIKRFLTKQSGALLGRALPFGIGAVVGGGANLALGKKVVSEVENAFGTPPAIFPDEISGRAPRVAEPKQNEAAGEVTV
ncbi:di- and tripeptidase [Rothia sp. ZJ932]|nr:di- and tripeptidase [Rothia sp. ZJ1223]QRZ62508.1 di- and tripeptidase [Rothia sp. ZJ932]